MHNKLKNFVIILTIFLVLLTIAGVSAEDSANQTVISSNDEDVIINDNLIEENDKLLLDEEDSSFTDLNGLIQTSNDIELESDYSYDASKDSLLSNGITIDKEVSINGNNHTINPNGNILFNIQNNGKLTLTNMNIVNSYSNTNAMILNNGELVLDKINFTVERIFDKTGTSLKYNTIQNTNTLTISNCIFKDSSIKTTFPNTSQRPKTLYYNGLVYNNGGVLSVENTIFKNNQFIGTVQFGNAPRIAPIIVNDNGGKAKLDKVSVIDTLCTYTHASYNYFGFLKNEGNGELTISNSLFDNNKITNTANMQSRGLINSQGSSLSITNTTFKGNDINYQVVYTTDKNIEINGNLFDSNTVLPINVATMPSSAKVNYNIFVNNNDGGYVIASSDDELDIENNYWGTNSPDWNSISDDNSDLIADNYVVLNITGSAEAIVGQENSYTVTLNQIKNRLTGVVSDLEKGILPNYQVSVKSLNLDSVESVLIENGVGIYNYIPQSEGEDTLSVLDSSIEQASLTVNAIADAKDGSYTELNRLINESEGKIILDKNYTFDDSKDSEFQKGIVIDKEVSIDGNGFTINSTDKAKLFDVKSTGNLILENIILLNDYAVTQSGIINAGQTSFNNVTFTAKRQNNAATVNLQAPIINTGDMIISGSYFKDSIVNHTGATMTYVFGSLIYNNKGSLEIENTIFSGNGITSKAKMVTVNGGLIYNSGDLTLNDVTVSNNYINIDGSTTGTSFGLIYGAAATSNININNSTFKNNMVLNTARTDSSLANVIRVNNGNITVNNSNFIRNIGSKNGGAITYVANNDIIIENSLFDSNAVSGSGGALFIQGNLISNNNQYIKNTAKHQGGAIYNYAFYDTGRTDVGNLKSNNDLFDGNTVETPVVSNLVIARGGAIYAYSGNVTLLNDTFKNNKAIGGIGGVIYNNPNNHLNASKCIFIDNEATKLSVWPESTGYGSIMIISEPENLNEDVPAIINIEYSIIENNVAEGGYAIAAVKPGLDTTYTLDDYVLKVNNNYWGTNDPDFNELFGIYDSDSVLVEPENFVIMDIEGPDSVKPNTETIYTINLNKVNESGEIKGISTYLPDYEVDIEPLKNSVTPETVVIKEGSAEFTYIADNECEDTIYGTKNLDDRCEKQISVVDGFEGTEIFVNGNVGTSGNGSLDSPLKTIAEAIDLANSAKHPVTVYILSGTYSDINMVISNNVTISNYEDSDVTLDANHNGWFFYSENSDNYLTLIGLTFVNGEKITSNYADGGVIKSEGPLTVINCTFINNTARKGGAIHAENGLEVINSEFINNTAKGSQGGAIYASGDTQLINDTFDNNVATGGSGGAVRVQGNLNVENSTFENNKAGSKRTGDITNGGAISVTDSSGSGYNPSTITVKNSEFTNNDAFNGGAISSGDNVNVTVDNSSFVGNKAVFGAGISANDGSVNITDSLIANNTVSDEYTTARLGDGVGVNVQSGDITLEGNTILNNSNPYNSDAMDIRINEGDAEVNNNYWGENQTARIKSNNGEVVVNKITTELAADNLVMTYKDGSQWAVTLIDYKGNAMVGAIVKFGILNKIYSIKTDDEGVAKLPVNLLPNVYEINATYEGDNNYESAFVNATITIGKATATLTTDNLVMTYKDGSGWTVSLTDKNGVAIADVKVNMGISGKVYQIKTDSEGIATLPINLNPGTYNVNASLSNSVYEAELITANVTVNKAVPVLSADDLVMSYKDGSNFSVTLTDADGNAIANSVVKMTINGKTYNSKTDENGVATLPINLKIGKYEVAVQFDGNAKLDQVNVTKEITVEKPVMNITAENINMTYKDGTSYAVQLTDGQGNPVNIAGEIVKITINGKTYDRKTNADGVATLPINLGVGEYTISAEYNESQITSTITVNKA